MKRLATAVIIALMLAAQPVTAAFAASRPLDVQPASGLAVYTSPNPSTVASTAYVYSPVTLAAAPVLRVVDPYGRPDLLRAEFSHDAPPGQWWTAPLPGRIPGTWRVTASGKTATGSLVSGTSSYEIVGTAVTPGPRWTSAGPGAIGGLLAGSDEHPTGLYLASGTSAETYASHDAGLTWQLQRTLPVAGGYPTDLLALPGRHPRLVLSINSGNGQYVVDPTYTGKVLESDDGGQHWRDLGLPDSFVTSVVASPDGSTLIAITRSGLEITRDDGAHWRTIANPWGTATASDVALIDGDLYVATSSGLYVLRDAARATTAPTLIFTPPGGRSAWTTAVSGDAHTLYAATFLDGVFASTDAGATWTHVYTTSGLVTLFDDVRGVLYVEAGSVLAEGTDSGTHWTDETEPVPGAEYTAALAVGPKTYLATVDAGISVSDRDGAAFHPLSGVPALDVYGVTVAHNRIIAGTTSNTYSTAVANAALLRPSPWEPLRPQTVSGTTTPLLATSADGSMTYKVRSGPRVGTFTVYSSPDGGLTWKTSGQFYGNAGALLVDPADPSEICVTGHTAFDGSSIDVSRDGGQTWTTTAIPGVGSALAGDPSDPDQLWVGGPAGLWSSHDDGQTFTALDTEPVTALAVTGSHRLIVGGADLRYSDNGGRTLRVAHRPGFDLSVSSLALSPGRQSTMFAGSGAFHEAGLLQGGHGVFASTDGGQSWFEFDNGLGDRDVTSLALTPDGKRLFAGTTQGGVFTITTDLKHPRS